jgi:hypothetical protein
VRAIIGFAAGRGGHFNGKPNNNCAPDNLVEAAAQFGQTARIPMLWIYLQTFRSTISLEAGRLVAAAFIALGTSMTATVASSQQVIPFGDVPATADFSEAEIAARGQQKPNLTYSTWKKLCFRGAQGADTKMVCRTSIEGKSDL